MNKEDIRELAEDNAIYEFNKFKKIYGNYTDEYVRHFYNKLAELRGGIDDVHTCNCQHDSNSRDNEPCYKYDSRTAVVYTTLIVFGIIGLTEVVLAWYDIRGRDKTDDDIQEQWCSENIKH